MFDDIINGIGNELSKDALTKSKRTSLYLPESLIWIIDKIADMQQPKQNRTQMIERLVRDSKEYSNLIKKCEDIIRKK